MELDAFTSTPNVTDGSIRCAFYGRYSSDNQQESSIDQQFRNCREAAEQKGWIPLPQYHQSDEEKTGKTKLGRPGLDLLMGIVKSEPKVIDYLVIDDTSRLGRNAAETLQLAKIIDFHRVSLFFVENGLDSRDRSYWDTFAQEAIKDEKYSRSLGHKVQRGRRDRFLKGYNPGGGCYGYRNVPDEDHTRKGQYGRPAVIGVKQVIDPETARIVVRIFMGYAEGMSYRDIAIMLNREGVPTSQGPRSKRKATWSKTAIRVILENTRYIGKLFWNTTKEEIDPETGKRRRSQRPRHEWETREAPELKVISDELWSKVQERRKLAARMGVQKCGGMTRTEGSRRYLLSGLMKCGLCGDNIMVVTSNPTRYGCANHRHRGECTNRATIKQPELEGAFVSALAENLRSEELREGLVKELHTYLQDMAKGQADSEMAAQAQRSELGTNRAVYLRQQANLLKAIKDSGSIRSLIEELKEVGAKIDRIDEILLTTDNKPLREISLEEVRDFVETHASSLDELLMGSAELVKREFQKRITAITLKPTVDERGLVFVVTGDVDLFSAPAGVMQANQVDLIGLQYKIPVKFEIAPYHVRKKWVLPEAA